MPFPKRRWTTLKLAAFARSSPLPQTDTKAAADVPAFSPSVDLKGGAELADKIIKDGRVDSDALEEIEKQNNPRLSAAAYFTAGKFEFDHGNFAKSKTYFETALRIDPANPSLLNYYAALLVRTGNAKEAIPYAERAVRVAPEFPGCAGGLGICAVWRRSYPRRGPHLEAVTGHPSRRGLAAISCESRARRFRGSGFL